MVAREMICAEMVQPHVELGAAKPKLYFFPYLYCIHHLAVPCVYFYLCLRLRCTDHLPLPREAFKHRQHFIVFLSPTIFPPPPLLCVAFVNRIHRASVGRPSCFLGGSFWSLNIIASFSLNSTFNFSQYLSTPCK